MVKKRSRDRYRSRAPTPVSVLVPKSVARRTPSVLIEPPVRQRIAFRRNLPIHLAVPRERLVKKTYYVYGRKKKRLRQSYVIVNRRGQVKIRSQRMTNRMLRDEYNRQRRDRKPGSRRHDGHLESIKYDRTGIVRSNLKSHPGQIMDAAMVARAVSRYV